MYTINHVKVRVERDVDSVTLTIPFELSRRFDLRDGDEVQAKLDGSLVVLRKERKRLQEIRELSGCFKDVDIETPIQQLRERWASWIKPSTESA